MNASFGGRGQRAALPGGLKALRGATLRHCVTASVSTGGVASRSPFANLLP